MSCRYLLVVLALTACRVAVGGMSLVPEVAEVLERFVAGRIAVLTPERLPEGLGEEYTGLRAAWASASGEERSKAAHGLYRFLLTHHLHGEAAGSVLSQEEEAALAAIGYVDFGAAPAAAPGSGVLRWDRERAQTGRNFYMEGEAEGAGAVLMEMDGTAVGAWPDLAVAKLATGGDVLGLDIRNQEARRVGADGKTIRWSLGDLDVHHEIIEAPGGQSLYLMDHEYREYAGARVQYDRVCEYSMEGVLRGRWSVADAVEALRPHHLPSPLEFAGPREARAPFPDAWPVPILRHPRDGGFFDAYHLNSLQLLPDTQLGSKDERFHQGNWLVSFRNLDLVAVLHRETKAVLWSYGPGELDGQHTPALLETGNILIFDNGYRRGYSRVIEVEPGTGTIAWQYPASADSAFFSKTRGSAQRLENGNTLIVESEKGRAIEITRNLETVWEWVNPIKNASGAARTVYRMYRVGS